MSVVVWGEDWGPPGNCGARVRRRASVPGPGTHVHAHTAQRSFISREPESGNPKGGVGIAGPDYGAVIRRAREVGRYSEISGKIVQKFLKKLKIAVPHGPAMHFWVFI